MTRDEFAAALIVSEAIHVDTELGEVYALRGPRGTRLKKAKRIAHLLPSGYRVGSFKIGNERKQLRLHRVVWIAANGVPAEGMAVCHLNNQKDDNRIANLYLATPQQNSADAARDGLYKPTNRKIDAETVALLTDDYRRGEGTMRELAERYGISKSRVQQLVSIDGWTQLGDTADSKRYSALGDAVTVNVSHWIGTRFSRASGLEAVTPDKERD